MPRKKRSNAWLLALLALLGFGLAAGTAKADPGGDDDDDDDDKPDGPIVVTPPASIDPTPAQVDDVVKTYPGPAAFYVTKQGDEFTSDGNKGGIATRYGYSCLFLAAKEIGGYADEAALLWAKARGGYSQMRRPATLLIQCAPYNDARFGTYSFNAANTIVGPNGRGIRLLPNTAPDIDRIRQGKPAIRNVKIGKPGDGKGVSVSGVNPSYRKLPTLWLPGCDLQALFESDGTVWQAGGTWGDGSSKIHPPPLIYALGVVDLTNAGVDAWGCAPNLAEVPKG